MGRADLQHRQLARRSTTRSWSPGCKALLGEDKWAEKMNLLSFEGTVNPEKILSAVLMMSVAEGMRGILVIALIAAALSTFGSWVNLATGQFVNDFYKKWIRPKAQTRELIFASWGTVVGIVTCSFLFSLTLDSINDIWGWMMMGFGAGFLVPSLLRLYWWRFNGSGSAIGTLVGIVAAIVQRLVWPDLSEVWQFVFVLTVGFVSSVAAALLTEPTDPEVLQEDVSGDPALRRLGPSEGHALAGRAREDHPRAPQRPAGPALRPGLADDPVPRADAVHHPQLDRASPGPPSSALGSFAGDLLHLVPQPAEGELL